MLSPQKYKTKNFQAIHNHYASPTNPNIIKIDDTEDKTQLTQVIMVPTKWERKFLLEICTQYDLINYLETMVNEWEADIIEKM